MAKKKTTRTAARVPKEYKKAHVLTWVVFVALIVGLVGGYLIAKTKYIQKIGVISIMFNQKDSELNEMKAKMGKMNRVLKEGGEVWVTKDGDVILLDEELTLPNGTVVTPNGRYMKPGKEYMMLQEGEALDLEGNVVTQQEEIKF